MAYQATAPPTAQLRKPAAAKKKAGGKELTSFKVDIAENGYVMRCQYESKDKEPLMRNDNKTNVFESARALIEFLEETLEGEE